MISLLMVFLWIINYFIHFGLLILNRLIKLIMRFFLDLLDSKGLHERFTMIF
jgi:hypothetical protein